MASYLELSRPQGYVGRWEKVIKRIMLINKNYPIKTDAVAFHKLPAADKVLQDYVQSTVLHLALEDDLIIMGPTAIKLIKENKNTPSLLDIQPNGYFMEVMAENAETSAKNIMKALENGVELVEMGVEQANDADVNARVYRSKSVKDKLKSSMDLTLKAYNRPNEFTPLIYEIYDNKHKKTLV